MRLGFYMGYAPPGTNPTELIALAQEAEQLGYDSAWAAEAWGADAVTVLSWLAATTSRLKVGSAILQIPARTPAATAMTAATLDLMSGGRFLLGGAVSIWRLDTDTRARTVPQTVFAVILLLAAALASVAGVLWLVGSD